MKKILIVLATLALAACSSGGGSNAKPGDKPPGVTEFGQKMAGEWLLECTQNPEGSYKEILMINDDGTGEVTTTDYQTQNCMGTAKIGEAQKFTYTVNPVADGSAQVTITSPAGQSEVNISVLGNVLEIEWQNGKLRYLRSQQNQKPPTATPGGDDFDRLAKGIWISDQCFQYENNTTARQQLTINGRGSASIVIQVYQSQDCSGRSRAERAQDASYRVDHFANGQGQITVNNQPADVSFQANRMTITDANGTIDYNKTN